MSETGDALFVGIDWSTREQVFSIHDESGEILVEKSFPYSGDGLAAFCADLARIIHAGCNTRASPTV